MSTTITLEDVHPFQQFTPIEVGRLLRIHPDSVKRLAVLGELQGVKLTDKGMWRFSAAQIKSYLENLTAKAALGNR